MHPILRLTVAGLIAAGVMGCGGKKEKPGNTIGNTIAEKMAEQALKNSGQEGAVHITKDGMQIETEGGAFKMAAGENLSIPADFPKAVPVYDGAKVAQVVTTPEGAHLMLATPDAPADVVTFYKSTLEAAGWKSQMAMQTPDGDMLTYLKDKESIAVIVGRNAEGTTMTVTYSHQ